MTRGSRSVRVWVWALALFAVLAPLGGCDPGHPFAEVRVKVQSRADGSAVLTAWIDPASMSPLDTPPEELPDASPVDDGIVSAALVADLDLGRVEGEPQNLDREFGADAVGVEFVPAESNSLTFDLGDFAAWLRSIGVRDEVDVYVLVCNAAGRGGATARYATIEWSGSCGVWSGELSGISPDAWITLRPAQLTISQGLPVAGSALGLLVLAALMLVGLIALSPRWRRRRRAAVLTLVIVATIDAFIAAVFFATRGLDSWFSVGQNLGGPPWDALSGLSMLLMFIGVAVTVIHVSLLASDRSRSRYTPPVRR